MAFFVPLIGAAIAGGGAAAAGGSLATALTVGSAALTGISGLQAGLYQSAVAKSNAEIATRNANKAGESAQLEAQRSDAEYSALAGEQLATQSASGLDVLGRSQLQTRQQTRTLRAREAGNIIASGRSESNKLFSDAANFKAEASAAKTQGFVSAAGAALSLGGQYATGQFRPPVKSTLVGEARPVKKKYPWEKTKPPSFIY